MKNKVLLIGGYNLPQGNASAVRAIGNAKLLAEIGYCPIIVGKIMEKSEQNWYEFDGVKCFDIECANDKYGYGINFLNILTSTISRGEIYAVIAYNFPAKALSLIRKYCIKNSIAIVSDATEWYAFEVVNNHFISALRRKMQTEYRMRILNKKIGNIICSTNYIANYYSFVNTVVIPMIDDNSFAENVFHSTSVGSIRRFIYAGSPGHRFKKDKINVIVKLFERLKADGCPYELSIYGITQEQYKAVFQYNFINDELHKIIFYGRVPRNKIEKALHDSDFYVLYRPNTKVCRVGFSTKAMEATSNCVPLIANDINGDFHKYYTHNQALICGPDSEDDFYHLLKIAIGLSEEAVLSMKKSCFDYNPYHYKNYVTSMKLFMKGIGNGIE